MFPDHSNANRAITWNDVLKVMDYLNESGTEYALVGGYALFAHGIERQTNDIDILVNPSVENQKKWIFALSRLPEGVVRELENEGDVFSPDYTWAIRINDEFVIDVMPAVCGKNWEFLKSYIEPMSDAGIEFPVLSLEGLLLTKEGLRPKDQMDRASILHILSIGQEGKETNGSEPG